MSTSFRDIVEVVFEQSFKGPAELLGALSERAAGPLDAIFGGLAEPLEAVLGGVG